MKKYYILRETKGQIGEKFVKEVFKALNLPLDELPQEIIHDEFDLLSRGKKVEIKTKRIFYHSKK